MEHTRKIDENTTKKEWAKPTVTEIDVKDTASGPINEEVEDPNYMHYGPHS